MLLALAATLAAGLAAPFVIIDKWMWQDAHSVLGLANGLWRDGDVFLFVVIGLLVIVNPIVKVGLMVWIYVAVPVRGRWIDRALALFELVSRFAMVDVFVMAIVVVALHPGGVFSIAVHAGVYCFVAHILLSVIAVRWLKRLVTRARAAA